MEKANLNKVLILVLVESGLGANRSPLFLKKKQQS